MKMLSRRYRHAAPHRWKCNVELHGDCARVSCPGKVDESALWVGADQLDAQLVSHICALTMHQQTLHMRREYPNKSSFRGSASNNGVKYLADAAAHAHGGNAL